MKKDGVLTVQLTYNNRNLAGDGALEPANAGLSKLGRATIERIEAEKLLARPQPRRSKDRWRKRRHMRSGHWSSAIQARGRLTDHVPQHSDETIKAVADKGGVVGVYFMPFLTPTVSQGRGLLRHVEHVANVAGEDHVGIGTDNGRCRCCSTRQQGAASEMGARADQGGHRRSGRGRGRLPDGPSVQLVDRYRRFASDLQKRGWSESRLEKLMGGNFLRVYREAWGG
jgi:membrane dipeptidase